LKYLPGAVLAIPAQVGRSIQVAFLSVGHSTVGATRNMFGGGSWPG